MAKYKLQRNFLPVGMSYEMCSLQHDAKTRSEWPRNRNDLHKIEDSATLKVVSEFRKRRQLIFITVLFFFSSNVRWRCRTR